MEQGFSDRLKRYRKEKNLTQQELADALGVSNKSVSRWESEGGYPDVPLLVPLARALGVTVDDLLDEEKPVRTLTRADWQSLLSFAFALGGGLLFYLLNQFAPLAVSYAVYLACLVYGAWLQRYYARHSRWFWLGAAAMDLAVNLSAAGKLTAALTALYNLALYTSPLNGGAAVTDLLKARTLVVSAGLALAALAVTAVTMWQLRARFADRAAPPLPALVWRMPRGRALLPLAAFGAVAGFWAVYTRTDLPDWCWQYQGPLLAALLAVLALGLGVTMRRRRAAAWLCLALTLAAWPLRQLHWVRSLSSGKLYGWSENILMDYYLPLWQPSPALFALLAALAVLWLLAAGLETDGPIWGTNPPDPHLSGRNNSALGTES